MATLQEALNTLNATTLRPWDVLESGGNKVLRKDFIFSSFPVAFAFMTQVAAASERLKHHPRWSNVYNRVSIALSTQEAANGLGAVTNKDFALAWEIEAIARRFESAGDKE